MQGRWACNGNDKMAANVLEITQNPYRCVYMLWLSSCRHCKRGGGVVHILLCVHACICAMVVVCRCDRKDQ